MTSSIFEGRHLEFDMIFVIPLWFPITMPNFKSKALVKLEIWAAGKKAPPAFKSLKKARLE